MDSAESRSVCVCTKRMSWCCFYSSTTFRHMTALYCAGQKNWQIFHRQRKWSLQGHRASAHCRTAVCAQLRPSVPPEDIRVFLLPPKYQTVNLFGRTSPSSGFRMQYESAPSVFLRPTDNFPALSCFFSSLPSPQTILTHIVAQLAPDKLLKVSFPRPGLPCGTERGFSASCPAPTGSPTGAANFQTAPFWPQKSHHSLSERKFHCKNPGSDTNPGNLQ